MGELRGEDTGEMLSPKVWKCVRQGIIFFVSLNLWGGISETSFGRIVQAKSVLHTLSLRTKYEPERLERYCGGVKLKREGEKADGYSLRLCLR